MYHPKIYLTQGNIWFQQIMMVSRLNSIITDKRFNELQGFETPMNQKLPHSRNLHWQGCSKGIPKYTRMKFHKEFDLSPSISRFPLFSLFNVDGWLHHHSSGGDSLKDSHLKLAPTRWTVLIYSQNVGPTIHLLTRQKKKRGNNTTNTNSQNH